MGRRDEAIFNSPQAVQQWLDEFGHTIEDEQAKKIIDYLLAGRRLVCEKQS